MASDEIETESHTGSPGTLADSPRARSDDSPAPTSGALTRGGLLGRYVVIDRLGAGGMGVVYAAYDPELNRRVAIKLVVPRRGVSADEQLRLLREAQALARVSHPNIVAIYDVGSVADRVFIAMELVDGETLDDWLRSEPSWREVVARFVGAGEGLTAAHEAGLIHRDFKPANVLVGKDGRVRVMDFGLARALHADSDHASDVSIPSGSSGDVLSAQMTQAGTVMGTPVYMPPEAFEGKADALGDQFSFAVALYQGLYRQSPFDAKLPDTDPKRWQLREPRGTAVPGWVRAIVHRGLAVDPAARYPSMRELVDALGRDPSIARRRTAGVVAAVLMVGIGVATVLTLAGRDAPGMLCDGAEAKLAGLWDASRKEAARATVGAAWPGIEAIVDRYMTDWAAMHRDACEATRVRGEQSEHVMTLRMACLERRRTDLGTATELLGTRDLAAKAIKAAYELPSLDRCADVVALDAPVPPPEDPTVRARADAIYATVARGRATREVDVLQRAAAAADSLGWAPLVAEARLELGEALMGVIRRPEAERAYEDALVAALAGGDDRLLTRTLIHRATLRGIDNRIDLARHDIRWVDALVGRLNDDDLRAEAWLAAGVLETQANQPGRALELTERALALVERRHGPDALQTAKAHYQVANVLIQQRRAADAERHTRRALDIQRRRLGPSNQEALDTLNMLALAISFQGREEDAVVVDREVEAITRELYGPGHQKLAEVLSYNADKQVALGQLAKASATLDEAISIYETVAPADPNHGFVLMTKARVLEDQGQLAQAIDVARRGTGLLERSDMPAHYRNRSYQQLAELYGLAKRAADGRAVLDRMLATMPSANNNLEITQHKIEALVSVGTWHLDFGTAKEALPHLTAAHTISETLASTDDYRLMVLGPLAKAYVELSRFADAVPLLETALAWLAKTPDGPWGPSFVVDLKFTMARAQPGDRPRALKLAKEALAACAKLSEKSRAKRQPAIVAWLATNGR